MTNIFRVSHFFQFIPSAFMFKVNNKDTRATPSEITAKYEKRGKYLSYCTRLPCDN